MAVMNVEAAPRMEQRAVGRESLDAARFRGEVELLRAIRADEALGQQLERTEVLRRQSRIRARLLSNAVRVNGNLVPHVARSLDRVADALSTDKPLEAYVFAEPMIHAFVTEASSRYLVAVSSGAVDLLGAEELEFVIGHELGHAVYGHLEIAVEAAIELGSLSSAQCRLLRGWQRASEISADRVGLLCCDSLDVAAAALFKTICGLDLPGAYIDPVEFARQWDGLAEEVLEQGSREYWKLSHPFPPLRMQALLLFWSGRADDRALRSPRRENPSTASHHDVDHQVGRLLAHMGGHGAAKSSDRDPLLSRFLFWGSLYVALADRGIDRHLLGEFDDVAPPGFDPGELLHANRATPELCLARFCEAKRTRRQKLSSKELHALITEFVAVAARRGSCSERGIQHITQLGQELGIGTSAVRLLIDKRTR